MPIDSQDGLPWFTNKRADTPRGKTVSVAPNREANNVTEVFCPRSAKTKPAGFSCGRCEPECCRGLRFLESLDFVLGAFEDFPDFGDLGRIMARACRGLKRRFHQVCGGVHHFGVFEAHPRSPVSGLLGALPDSLHGLGFFL